MLPNYRFFCCSLFVGGFVFFMPPSTLPADELLYDSNISNGNQPFTATTKADDALTMTQLEVEDGPEGKPTTVVRLDDSGSDPGAATGYSLPMTFPPQTNGTLLFKAVVRIPAPSGQGGNEEIDVRFSLSGSDSQQAFRVATYLRLRKAAWSIYDPRVAQHVLIRSKPVIGDWYLVEQWANLGTHNYRWKITNLTDISREPLEGRGEAFYEQAETVRMASIHGIARGGVLEVAGISVSRLDE